MLIKLRLRQKNSFLINRCAFTILISIAKLTRKQTDSHQADFCERSLYLQCLNYSVIELQINYKRRFRMETV